MANEPSRPLTLSVLLICTILWGITFPMFYVLFQEWDFPPILFATLRMMVMTPFLLGFLFISFGPGKVWGTLKQFKWTLFFFGLTNACLSNIFQNFGMTMTSPAITSIIQASGPIFVILLALLFLKEGLNRFKVIGIILAMVGSVFLVTGMGFDIPLGSLIGNLLVFGSAISYAVSTIIAKGLMKKVSPLMFVGLGQIMAAIQLIPVSIGLHISGVEDIGVIAGMGWEFFALLLFLSLGPGCVAIFAWYIIMSRMEVTRQVFFVYLVPIFGIIFSWIVVNDVLALDQFIFAAVIIAGVFVSQIKPGDKKPKLKPVEHIKVQRPY